MYSWNTLFRAGALISIAVALSGCGAMKAQNPGGDLSPINAVDYDSADHLMLFGADVVGYFTEKRYLQGSPEHRSDYKGVTFYFASPENKALFDANPTAYLPQYGGYCANGISFAIPWGGNAEDFIVHDGKLYIFGGELSRQAFMLDRDGNLALADKYWEEEIQGSNSFWQRTKRLIVRVPHYQTGDEQVAAVRAAQQAVQ